MLKRTYSIYNTIDGIDERSIYLKKRKRVYFRDKPIVKEYYKVNTELNRIICRYIHLFRVIDYGRFRVFNEYNTNKEDLFKYICYIMTIRDSEDMINLLNMLNINPDDNGSLLFVDEALEEIKKVIVFDNSI